VVLCPLRLFLDRLRRFSRLAEGVEFSTQVVALPFGLFASAAFPFKLLHRLATFILERGLCSFG
jgi:hypothetical protein